MIVLYNGLDNISFPRGQQLDVVLPCAGFGVGKKQMGDVCHVTLGNGIFSDSPHCLMQHRHQLASIGEVIFHEKWEVILKNENAMQIRDAVDKILTAAERLAMSLVSVIDSFPGEDGATDLLKMIADQNEEDILHSVERTIMMVAKTQE